MIPNEKELVEAWEIGVLNKADLIDPEDTGDWRALAYGFAMGNGHPIELAEEFVDLLIERDLLYAKPK